MLQRIIQQVQWMRCTIHAPNWTGELYVETLVHLHDTKYIRTIQSKHQCGRNEVATLRQSVETKRGYACRTFGNLASHRIPRHYKGLATRKTFETLRRHGQESLKYTGEERQEGLDWTYQHATYIAAQQYADRSQSAFDQVV